MKKIFFCLLAVMVGVVGAKSLDKSLLIGKTWQCALGIDEGGVSGKGSGESVYKKDGTFSAKAKVVYTQPKEYTLEVTESGTWKLDGDKLIETTKTFSAKSKEAPEIAQSMEELMKVSIKESEEFGQDEDDYITIVGLSENKLVTTADVDFGAKTIECKAK